MRLGAFQTGLRPSVLCKTPSDLVLLIVSRENFCCGSIFWVLKSIFVLFEPYERFHI